MVRGDEKRALGWTSVAGRSIGGREAQPERRDRNRFGGGYVAQRMSSPIRVLAVALLVFVTACGGGSDGSPSTGWQTVDGATVAVAALDGKPTVVNFFASWCTPCLLEMPAFEEVHQQMKGKVSFLGLNLQEDRSRADKVVKSTGVTYTVGLDPKGDVYRAFGAKAMPATAFLDSNGKLVTTHAGALTKGDLVELIRTKLGVS